ncbi:GlmU family protein [Adhaeribacter radiodurans]|uniref:GlmU family protein n=1 Tax=Adhaeribacter radiodurans TaxID=2745197 RepID=A0A7L7L3M9_9BACT|nr:GlmU family protein [Adhaeribacter radiodurans]QMU27185.1 GlmU family protein [Adhaeribacter radiodurans]
MNIILFDDKNIRPNLLPLTFTRPVAEIRVGILTIAEKWQKFTGQPVSYLTQPYLQKKYSCNAELTANIYINGAVCPNADLLKSLKKLKPGKALFKNNVLLAFHGNEQVFETLADFYNFSNAVPKTFEEEVTIIQEVWEIFTRNGQQIKADFNLITKGRQSCPVTDPHTVVYAPENIFLEEGVKLRSVVLNAESGPIYLGKNCEVQEGAVIRGAFALGEGSMLNMGARMRGDITIGPFCKVGGEISNSVIFGNSNKSHDGFLGNSVLGEWVNLGADTNTSNMKNNYADVKLWNYAKGGMKNTGLQFCGTIMGDHTKCGINTMLNTGTVTGVSANVFGAGYPRNFIPSFTWGGAPGMETYQLPKFFESAARALERRQRVLDEVEKSILSNVYEQTKEYRTWEKA